MMRKTKKAVQVIRVNHENRLAKRKDYVITEEPLELRLIAGSKKTSVAITMRTPGHDFELAAGFLFAEGVIDSKADITGISYCLDREVSSEQRYNIVNVSLAKHELPALANLERHFFTTSACGVCGKASLDALELRGYLPLSTRLRLEPDILHTLPAQLASEQSLFKETGGLHAAALFSRHGELLALREDVGRHNALDKLIGWALLNDHLPLSEMILLVSGRASYELLQKALSAGISLFCAVSAPSSLAVDLARKFNISLIGFLRKNSFNIYHDASS